MAIDYQTQFNAIQATQGQFPTTSSWALYSAVLKPLIVEAQTQGIAADATATAFLQNNRRFLVNNDGVDHFINYNGFPFRFQTTKAYCLHADEAAFFLGKAIQSGFGIVDDPSGTSYFGGNGIVLFYFF